MRLQILIITGIFCFLVMILLLLRKNAFSLKYALLWLVTAVIMLVIGVCPQLLTYIAHMLGFEVPSNAVFTVLLGLVILILLQQTSIVSGQSEKIKVLVQRNALLEKRIRELEEDRE